MEVFTLRLDLGNEAMQTTENITQALRWAADRLDSGVEGVILDANGNTVGSYGSEANE